MYNGALTSWEPSSGFTKLRTLICSRYTKLHAAPFWEAFKILALPLNIIPNRRAGLVTLESTKSSEVAHSEHWAQQTCGSLSVYMAREEEKEG